MFSIKVQFQRLVTCIDYTQKSIATTSIIHLQDKIQITLTLPMLS